MNIRTTFSLFTIFISCTANPFFTEWSDFNKRMRTELWESFNKKTEPQHIQIFEQDAAPLSTLADIKGAVPQEIYDLRDYLAAPERYKSLGIPLNHGILLVGKPGTGKTSIARALAGEVHAGFFYASGSEFIELYVGVGAQRIRELFNKARSFLNSNPHQYAIIFIDEIDAIGKRSQSFSSGEELRTVNELLTQMDGFNKNDNIIVLAATNRVDLVDEALLRPGRFDEVIEIPLPDRATRLAILEYYLLDPKFNRMVEQPIDLLVLANATQNWSGAELESVIKKAAVMAARAGHIAIAQDDLNKAFAHVKTMRTKRS